MRFRNKKRLLSCVGVVVLIAVYVAYCLLRSVPIVGSTTTSTQTPAQPAGSKIAWPASGESAVAIDGSGDVITHGATTPVPTASVAKLITTLVILRAKPLAVGQTGPLITLTANDVAIYDKYVAEQGSVVPVAAGETLTEYQMLQAMLLPSANNMADSLAIWAYGSLNAYSLAANAYITSVGLSQTHVGIDASGYDPSTTSTAHDLVLLGELALRNPVIAGIVAQPSVTGIPLTTTVKNINSLLGTNGVIGVKTGNTTQAGGVFVSASQVVVGGKARNRCDGSGGHPNPSDSTEFQCAIYSKYSYEFWSGNADYSDQIVGRYK